jgi:hypothetical protein
LIVKKEPIEAFGNTVAMLCNDSIDRSSKVLKVKRRVCTAHRNREGRPSLPLQILNQTETIEVIYGSGRKMRKM